MTTRPDIARHYARMQIQTSANPRAVCMLHERCTQLIQHAQGDQADKRTLLNHAQNILAQLERSLKVTDDLSQGLFYLYDYCYCLLENGTADELRKAIDISLFLRDTFDLLLKPAPEGANERSGTPAS